jgi:AcrR family transcriptional regulator
MALLPCARDGAMMVEPDGPGHRGLRPDAARNQERILLAAARAFEQLGPAASLEEVARRAGVGIATVYRRFGNRDQLVRAVFAHVFATEIEPAAATVSGDPWHDLAASLEGTIEAAAAHQGLLALAHETGAIDVDTADRYLGHVDRLLGRARQAGLVRPELEPRDVAAAVVMVLATVRRGAGPRAAGDWRRYLALLPDGTRPATAPLPARGARSCPRAPADQRGDVVTGSPATTSTP